MALVASLSAEATEHCACRMASGVQLSNSFPVRVRMPSAEFALYDYCLSFYFLADVTCINKFTKERHPCKLQTTLASKVTIALVVSPLLVVAELRMARVTILGVTMPRIMPVALASVNGLAPGPTTLNLLDLTKATKPRNPPDPRTA